MKQSILLLISLLVFSCQGGEHIVLQGKIDEKVNGQMELQITQNKVKGEYRDLKSNKVIAVEGTLVDNQLRLEEFAQENVLTGIFEGTYVNGKFNGNWRSPDKKTKVPFRFKSKNDMSIPTNGTAKASIKNLYAEWARNKNETSSEYCSETRCARNLKKTQNREDIANNECYLTISETFYKGGLILGDLNDDGIEDAVVTVAFDDCVDPGYFGNSMMFVKPTHHTLVFVSKGDTYQIIERIPSFDKYLERGGFERIEDGMIVGIGRGNSGSLDIPHWETDLEWSVQFKLKNGRIVFDSKSEVRKEAY